MSLGVTSFLLIIFVVIGIDTNVHGKLWNEDDVNLLNKQCGTKLADHLLKYAKFHNNVVAGRESQRFLVSTPVEAGLADRLMGIITGFWLAVFSNRAIQLSHYDKLPNFEFAFDYRFVNWTRHISDANSLTAPLFLTYKGIRDYQGTRSYNPMEVDTKLYAMEYMINNHLRAARLFGHTNLTSFPESSHAYPYPLTVFVSSNRIALRQLFTNELMKDYLTKIGIIGTNLEANDLFRCGYHFMFKENKMVMDIATPQLQSLLAETPSNTKKCYTQIPSVRTVPNAQTVNYSVPFILGIGMRLGDHVFQSSEQPLDLVAKQIQPFQSIAKQLQFLFAKENNCSISNHGLFHPWYAMADSLIARQVMKQTFGEEIVVDNRTVYYHGDCAYQKEGGCSEASLRHAIVYAVAQMYIYRQCTVKISTFGSGFPAVADMLTDKDKLILAVYYKMEDRTCYYPKQFDGGIMWRMDKYVAEDTSQEGAVRKCKGFNY